MQYRIFDAVYQGGDATTPATALILIGDPKQAIYAFRGADIHTYLQARRARAGRLYTLGTNYRSTHAMVRAANRCFAVAEERTSGPRAFLFRGEGGNPVPFIAAQARGRADALHAAGQEVPALTAWWMPPEEEGKPLTKDAYREQIAEVCASEMVRLLNLSQAGRAGSVGVPAVKRRAARIKGVVDDDAGNNRVAGVEGDANAGVAADAGAAPLRPLRPADLAVLVNKRKGGRPDPPRPGPPRGAQRLSLRSGFGLPEPPRPVSCGTGWPPAPPPTTCAWCAPPWPPGPWG